MLVEDAVQELVSHVAERRSLQNLRVRVEVSAIYRPAGVRPPVEFKLNAMGAATCDVEEFSLEGDRIYGLECDLVLKDVVEVRRSEGILAIQEGLDHATFERAVFFRL